MEKSSNALFECSLCPRRLNSKDSCCCQEKRSNVVVIKGDNICERFNLVSGQFICKTHFTKIASEFLTDNRNGNLCSFPFHVGSTAGKRIRPVPRAWRHYFDSGDLTTGYMPSLQLCEDCYKTTLDLLLDVDNNSNKLESSYTSSKPISKRWKSNISFTSPPSSESSWSITSSTPMKSKNGFANLMMSYMNRNTANQDRMPESIKRYLRSITPTSSSVDEEDLQDQVEEDDSDVISSEKLESMSKAKAKCEDLLDGILAVALTPDEVLDEVPVDPLEDLDEVFVVSSGLSRKSDPGSLKMEDLEEEVEDLVEEEVEEPKIDVVEVEEEQMGELMKDQEEDHDQIKDQMEDHIEDQDEDQDEDQIEDQIENQMEDQRKDQDKDQIKDQEEDQIEDQLVDQDEDQTEDPITCSFVRDNLIEDLPKINNNEDKILNPSSDDPVTDVGMETINFLLEQFCCGSKITDVKVESFVDHLQVKLIDSLIIKREDSSERRLTSDILTDAVVRLLDEKINFLSICDLCKAEIRRQSVAIVTQAHFKAENSVSEVLKLLQSGRNGMWPEIESSAQLMMNQLITKAFAQVLGDKSLPIRKLNSDLKLEDFPRTSPLIQLYDLVPLNRSQSLNDICKKNECDDLVIRSVSDESVFTVAYQIDSSLKNTTKHEEKPKKFVRFQSVEDSIASEDYDEEMMQSDMFEDSRVDDDLSDYQIGVENFSPIEKEDLTEKISSDKDSEEDPDEEITTDKEFEEERLSDEEDDSIGELNDRIRYGSDEASISESTEVEEEMTTEEQIRMYAYGGKDNKNETSRLSVRSFGSLFHQESTVGDNYDPEQDRSILFSRTAKLMKNASTFNVMRQRRNRNDIPIGRGEKEDTDVAEVLCDIIERQTPDVWLLRSRRKRSVDPLKLYESTDEKTKTSVILIILVLSLSFSIFVFYVGWKTFVLRFQSS